MDWTRKRRLMIRWSVLTSLLIAGFWGVWYLITGSVPVVHDINGLANSITWALPFENLSRWSDVVLGPIYSTLIILLATSQRWIRKNPEIFETFNSSGWIVIGTTGLSLVAGLFAWVYGGLPMWIYAVAVIWTTVGIVGFLYNWAIPLTWILLSFLMPKADREEYKKMIS